MKPTRKGSRVERKTPRVAPVTRLDWLVVLVLALLLPALATLITSFVVWLLGGL